MGKDEDADVATSKTGMFLPKRFRGERATVSEHPFQFGPFVVLNISGFSVEFLQQMVLARQ